MKKKPHPLLVFAACLVMAYLTGAFMSASFNLVDWPEWIRFFTGFFGIGAAAFFAFMNNVE